MWEETFRQKMISDFEKLEIVAIDLAMGTFDLVIEGKMRPYLVEIKKISPTPRVLGFLGQRGFEFTDSQKKAIERMKYPPMLVAFDDNGHYYYFSPEWVKQDVIARHRDNSQYPPALSYRKLLKKIASTL